MNYSRAALLALCWLPSQVIAQHRRSNPATVYSVDNVAITPVLLRQPAPIYPESLRHTGGGVRGTVWLHLVLDTLGRPEPESVRVDSSPNVGLNESARVVALASVFSPGEDERVRVRTAVDLPVTFDPRDSAPMLPVYGSDDSTLVPPQFVYWRPFTAGEPSWRFDLQFLGARLGNQTPPRRVVAQMIIDTLGSVEDKSLQIVRPADWLLTRSVARFFAHATFHPARRAGHPVRALVRIPLVFRSRMGAWVGNVCDAAESGYCQP